MEILHTLRAMAVTAAIAAAPDSVAHHALRHTVELNIDNGIDNEDFSPTLEAPTNPGPLYIIRDENGVIIKQDI